MSDEFEQGRKYERQETLNILRIITGVEDDKLLRHYLESWLKTLSEQS